MWQRWGPWPPWYPPAGPLLFLIVLVFSVGQGLLSLPTATISARYSMDMVRVSRRNGYIHRILQTKENAAEMRASQAGERLLERYSESCNEILAVMKNYLKRAMPYTLGGSLLNCLQYGLVLCFIVLLVIGKDLTKIGLYASLSLAAQTISTALSSLLQQVTTLYRNAASGEQLMQFFELNSEIEPPRADAAPVPEGVFSLELRDLSFRYPNSSFAMEGLQLSIPAGQRVAIVGENGAGKSTLTKLMLRLYDPDSGTVLVNGQDIRAFDVHDLRMRIGMAYQDVRTLAMSLRDNLSFYCQTPPSDEELREALHKLELDNLLERCGGDLDREVSREFMEDGVVLSGGEAQKLALARLMLGDFGLLLLDEPSAALDPLAEERFMQLLLHRANTATTIMVAHRLSTVRHFDIIYHVENGSIVECGTHEELMAARGGYYRMFTTQGKHYDPAE